jgi:hypothetical protein
MAFSMTACTKPDENDPSKGADPAEKIRQVNAALDGLDDQDFTLAQLGGKDALARTLVQNTGLDRTKYVGIFYFLWLGYSTHNRVFDIAKLNEQYPDRETSPLWACTEPNYKPAISANTAFHYFAEPLYGYYCSEDPWVIRKHLQLLAYAGVDYLLLDNTNIITYDSVVKAVADAILEMQAAGFRVPKIAFLLPNGEEGSLTVLNSINNLWFSGANKEKYKSIWFTADEEMNPGQKPLVVGRFKSALMGGKIPQTVSDNVWLKEMQWPGVNKIDDAIPWMDWNMFQNNHNGVMNVSIAQHLGGTWSSEAARYPANTQFRARGWTYDMAFTDEHGSAEDAVMRGDNFQQQWDYALSQDVDMVVVTGWNEWIAQKFFSGNKGNLVVPGYRAGNDHAVFVDTYDLAYSRDAEMMKGGYADNYYMQLADNIRRFKGLTVRDTDNLYTNAKKTVDISDLTGFDGLRKFVDIGTDTVSRNYRQIDPTLPYYEDETNRNNIVGVKVANDAESLYVLVETKDDIKPYTQGDNWMNLYISTDASGGHNGYHFVINRAPDIAAGTGSIEKITGAAATERLSATAAVKVSGRFIAYSVPLAALGLAEGKVIGIKAADNLQDFGNADDFYLSGDCAPAGRFNYAYKLA